MIACYGKNHTKRFKIGENCKDYLVSLPRWLFVIVRPTTNIPIMEILNLKTIFPLSLSLAKSPDLYFQIGKSFVYDFENQALINLN